MWDVRLKRYYHRNQVILTDSEFAKGKYENNLQKLLIASKQPPINALQLMHWDSSYQIWIDVQIWIIITASEIVHWQNEIVVFLVTLAKLWSRMYSGSAV